MHSLLFKAPYHHKDISFKFALQQYSAIRITNIPLTIFHKKRPLTHLMGFSCTIRPSDQKFL